MRVCIRCRITLPRLGHLDAVFIDQEKNAEDSKFTQLLGITQLGTQTYCYTAWEGKEPFWISRSELSKCLGSKPMVDQLVQELGAELPMRRREMDRFLEELTEEAQDVTQLAAMSSSMSQQAPPEARQPLVAQPPQYRAGCPIISRLDG